VADDEALPRVLLVDDDKFMLTGLAGILAKSFLVTTAIGGEEGVAIMEASDEPFEVVVSDYQMPGMNGAEFLARAKRIAPDTIRTLLTGHADLQEAASVVNEGAIFRFLIKPIETPELIGALHAGVEQYRLVKAEKELLEQTLAGSIKAMSELLALASPIAFERATRMRDLAALLFEAAHEEAPWHVGITLTLSQVGAITLPPNVLERMHNPAALSDEEKAMVARMPELAEQVLAEIPRLELVRDAIARQDERWSADQPLAARVLRIVRDYDMLESSGRTVGDALKEMSEDERSYDPALLRALAQGLADRTDRKVELLPVTRLRVGMTFAEDVFTAGGVKLIPRGYVITPNLLQRIRNFAHVAPGVSEPVCVFVGRQDLRP
jgi:response regulator RpfG family c-di-GMP phosphodiesterase